MEKQCRCAYRVWEAEVSYRDLIEFLDERKKDAALFTISMFKDALNRIEKDCEIDLTKAKEYAEDAREQIEEERWLDAKWSALWASSHLMDKITECAKIRRS